MRYAIDEANDLLLIDYNGMMHPFIYSSNKDIEELAKEIRDGVFYVTTSRGYNNLEWEAI